VKKWVIVLAACSAQPVQHTSGPVTRTAKVTKRDVSDRVLLTGALHAASAIDMQVPRTDSWQISLRWLAEDGTQVKAGERVIEYDNSSVTKELEQEKLTLIEAEMSLKSAQALAQISAAQKQTELDQAKIALAKATLLADVPADLLSGHDAQERQLEKKRQQIAVEKAQAALTSQRQQDALEIQVKQIELDKAKRTIDSAEKAIGELVVTAPRDGTFVVGTDWQGKKFHAGDNLWPGMTIASIPDPNTPMEVEADESDVDDGRVHVGMAGSCTLDAYPGEPLTCTVKSITPVASIKGEQSLRRAFVVVLELPKTDPRMRPGMSVKVELHGAPIAGATVVPRGALVFAKQVKARLADGSLRDVTIGPCDAQGCVVEKGLAEGEAVQL
jgi:multidrug efflux pump subunit AcrA (membrane-fusion protein)